jgi:hypothetical protein
MQELLSKSEDLKGHLRDQEFYELRLYDLKSADKLVYCVGEAHAQWCEVDGQIMWDMDNVQEFLTFQEAKAWYSARRLALAQLGFINSDVDLF